MNKVYESIHNVSKELSLMGLSKERRNQAQGYNFRGIDDVMNALSPLLVRHNLLILPRCISRDIKEHTTAKGGKMFSVAVEVEFDFVSTEDESKVLVKTYGEAMDSGDKATNKAMSAAYKYAAFQAFCIPVEGTPDADAETHEVASEVPAAKQQPATASTNPVVTKPKLTKDVALGIQQNFIGAMTQRADAFPSIDHLADTVKVALEKLDYNADQFFRLMQPLRYEWFRLACLKADCPDRDDELRGWLSDDSIRHQIGDKAADELLRCMELSAEESRRELAKLTPAKR